jgi:prevent-host-death family protein
MARATAAEIQKRFGIYSEIAQREPVTITNHGRDSLVLLSVRDYARLKAMDTRKAYFAWELPDDAVRALEEATTPEGIAAYDAEVNSDHR